MKIVMLKTKELIPYEKNPRKNEKAVDFVANSIKEFGFKNPIIIDKDNVIVAGHTRLLASKKLKINEVPCIYADDLTDEQIKAFRIADNSTAQVAEWDDDLLKLELDGLDFDMSDFGLDLDNISLDEEKEIIEDDAPEVDEENEPTSKLGDIYKLGRHRLMCGDSTKLEDVEKLMNGIKADLLITDPPYNVNYQGKTKSKLKIQNDDKDDVGFRKFLTDAFKSCDNVMKQGAVFYIWHADSEGYNFRRACFDVKWKVRQCLIWNKNTFVIGRQDYQWKHEPCLYGWKDGASHLWATDRKQTTVIDFNRPTKNCDHPTMKPVGLFDYQIKNNTKPEDIVLDVFGGSGTTLVACEQNGRTANIMELDPKYCDVIIKRYENLTGDKAIKL